MFTIKQINRHVLSKYPAMYRAIGILPLDYVGGFGGSGEVDCSGYSLVLRGCLHWRIETRAGVFCLRRWGNGTPDKSRLQFIQAVLWQAAIEGIEFVPLPIETLEHSGFVVFDGSYWELLPWMDGVEEPPPIRTAGFDDEVASGFTATVEQYDDTAIQPFRIVSAMMSLAQFHLAVSTFPIDNSPVGRSACINDMLAKWRGWVDGGFNELYRTIRGRWSASISELLINFAETGLRFQNNAVIYSGQMLSDIGRSSRLLVQIQPTIGNCCLRHLRFDYDGVSGMIDFKSIGVDSVVVDVASLLGSMASPETEGWKLGLRAYQRIRQLDDYEIFMLKSLYHSMILIEGLDYLSDFFLKGKPINEYQIDKITSRLEYWNLRMETENRNRNSA
ncbi:MAG: hypothetical protein LBL39_07845 [Planctomycetaceae bacterium]|jgi:hypothetical protein|nr:hypothetical protein [Planctomycetaceae bacterium]